MDETYQREMEQADQALRRDDFEVAFRHLERAHVLAQRITGRHTFIHWRMLVAGLRRGDLREVVGQVPRIVASILFSRLWVPRGNTGRARQCLQADAGTRRPAAPRALRQGDRAMEYIVGTTLALFFCAAAAGLGLDRERAFYPAVVIAVASYYLAFAVVDGRIEVMWSELAIAAVFIAGAVAGFKLSPWFAVVALGGHGVMDAFHHHLVQNTGVPQVWPGFCMSFDVVAAAIVAAVMLARARGDAKRQGLSVG